MTGGEIGLGARLARRLLPLTLVIGAVISVGLPATYYELQSRALQRAATIYAEEMADRLAELVIETPGLWRYQAQKYLRTLRDFVPHKDIMVVRMRDSAGGTIGDLQFAEHHAEAWWNRRAPMGAAALRVNNRTVGTLEVVVSYGALLQVTLSLLVLSTAFGAGLALLVYGFPVKVVRGMESQIEELVSTVRRSNAELERRRAEQASLAEAGRLLASTLDLREVLDRLMEIARELVGADIARIWLRHAATGGEFRLASHAGAMRNAVDESLHLIPGEGIVGAITSERRSVVLPDLRRDPRVKHRAWLEAEGIVSSLGVPLVIDGEAVGALMLLSRARREWGDGEVAVAEALAVAAATAIRNARVYERSEARRRAAEALAEVSRVVSQRLDPDAVGQQIVDAIAGLLGARSPVLYRFEEDSGRLTALAVGGDVPVERRADDVCPGAMAVAALAVRERQVVATSDVVLDPRLDLPDSARAGVAEAPCRAFLAVPLVVRGRVTGSLAVGDAAGRLFDDDTVRLAQAFADQAALALENARLYHLSEERRMRLAALLEVARRLTRGLDLPAVLGAIAEATATVFGGEAAFRLLQGDWLVRGAATPGARATMARERVRIGESLSGRVAATGQPLVTGDAASDMRVLPEHRSGILPERTGAIMIVPMSLGERILGTLHVYRERGYRFDEDSLELAMSLADQAAIAIENARLYEAAQQRLRHTETLVSVGRAVSTTLDLDEMLRRVARETARAFGADMVGAYLADPEQDTLRPVAGYHVPSALREAFLGFPIPLRGHRFVEEAWQGQHAVSSSDISGDSRFDRTTLERFPHQSSLFCPMIVKGAPIGGLFAVWWHERREFPPEEIRLVDAIAAQVALAIDNARLFEETERGLRESRSLLAVAESVGGTLDVVEVMRRVAREAARLLGADTAMFYGLEEEGRQVVPRAGYHVPPEFVELVKPCPVGESPLPIVEAFRSGTIFFSRDAAADDRVAGSVFSRADLSSMLAAPIQLKGRTFGCLALFWRRAAHDATPAELTLVGALASQAALALENARLFAETQAQAASLRNKNAELDSFVYSVSHDLKAPLVSIQGMSTILVEDFGPELGDEGRRVLGRIQANVERLERLISDLLALSRIGREARVPEPVDLDDVVEGVLAELADPLRARGVTVVRHDLGRVLAVRTQMEQVFGNLISNAMKYLGDQAAPTIEIGAVARGGVLECWVRDNGIGIDPAYHGKVFEIFHRLRDVDAEGTGVGLPIVKKIIETAGGRVWVESARHEGATFRFTWPAGPRENGHRPE
jgi:GAF domain-containing protein